MLKHLKHLNVAVSPLARTPLITTFHVKVGKPLIRQSQFKSKETARRYTFEF